MSKKVVAGKKLNEAELPNHALVILWCMAQSLPGTVHK